MVAAVVITYHPKVDELVQNILSFADAVDKVLIWRNSPEKFILPESIDNKAVLMGNGTNELMAGPLNEALRWCEANDFDLLLTMDQDSRWTNAGHFISRAVSERENDVAIYAPYVIGQYDRPVADYDAESVITSGSLVDVTVANKLGGFRKDYGIYWVDGEFCYWARTNGYRIKVFHDCELVQQFGKQTKTLFGFTTSNYSPAVYYYLIRNMLWMKREFHKGVSFKTVIYTLMYNIRGILLGEKRKLVKIHSINKGLIHGLCSKYDGRNRV